MRFSYSQLLLLLCTPSLAQDVIYAAYVVHRAGDRSAISLPSAKLTALGYDQVSQSGVYYRSRYVSNSSKTHIDGLSSQIVDNSQISVYSQPNAVLQNSAQAFLQGLYPAVGEQKETLANGVTVIAPFNGYQLIPVTTTGSSGAGDMNTWLQDPIACANARLSTRIYAESKDYQNLVGSTKDFYKRLQPVVGQTFQDSYMSYQNAYTTKIHNQSIPSSDLLDDNTIQQLHQLANQHEYGLAYNNKGIASAIAGMQLAGQALSFLVSAVNSKLGGSTTNKLGVQFNTHSAFLSFFGLANLQSASGNFTGIPDYASSMTFEVFGPAGSTAKDASDLKVRFLFSNGSTGISGEPAAYPLFGGRDTSISWTDFVAQMDKLSVRATSEWCTVCGNHDGYCSVPAGNAGSASSSGSQHGMSNVVAGVVGALVTLAVVMALQSALAVLGGWRLVKRRTLQKQHGEVVEDGEVSMPREKVFDDDASSCNTLPVS